MMDSGVDLTLHEYLNRLVGRFESRRYIQFDPIAIPHGFDDPRDQEIIALYSALLAWGRRDTLLRNLQSLCERMDYRPARFVRDFRLERDAHRLAGFKHRTLSTEDAVWLTWNLGTLIRRHGSVERLFSRHLPPRADHVGNAIEGFSASLLAADPATPRRLSKHLARPSTGSACKRLNMYLRWMVRPGPFDLCIWRSIATRQLVLPVDLHSGKQARRLGMLSRAVNDWKAALELTEACRRLDRDDPCRFDLALFGIGAFGVEIPDSLLMEPDS